jgi:serine/threonine protein kinase
MSKTIASPIPYEIKEILLETNAFSLLRATRASDKKTVILKALKTGNTHQQKTALEKEYELLKKLGDNITLKTTGLDWLQEKRAIIFSDPGGTTLNNVIIQNTDNLQTILQFCIQLTRCVAELHRNNLLHGAIQPKNIFYNEKTEKVFLINPQSNELKGISNNALEFFSPEQTERLDFTIDQRSDLYSIGATFYKVFTGEPPFTGNDTNELIHNILAHKPTPPHIKSNKIPAQLSAIILRLLEKNPDHRYQSACSLKNDLEICLEQLSQTGEIKPFILEAEENTPVLDLYTKFYGRTAQIKSILQTMHDARSGSTELFLISGPAGIGKTALVNKIKTDLQNKTALFGSGKFEQYQQAFPYLGWTKALTEISDNISQLDPDTVFSWRNSIINAVGKSGKALTAVIPAIEES